MHEAQKKLGAFFYETAGWERPHWYESNAFLLEEYGDAVMPREHEWDARWWSPIINAEHLRLREAAGVIDLTAFQVLDIEGPGALETVQRTCVAQCDVAVGKVVYTPVLDAGGGFRSDLTVMRLGESRFRVVTGGAHGMVDRKTFTDQLPDDAATTLADRHRRRVHDRPLGPPRARHPGLPDRRRRLRRGLRLPDLPRDRSPGRQRRRARCWPPGSPTSASSAGSCTCRWTPPRGLWEALLEAGAPYGAVPVGIGVYGTTGRIEKGYRAYGAELDGERSIVEAGMARPKVKAADFVGKEAYLAQRAEPPKSGAVHAQRRRPHVRLGHEAVHARRRADPDPRGRRLTDGHGRHPYVTSAGSAPSLGKHLLLAYLPPEQAVVGTGLASRTWRSSTP